MSFDLGAVLRRTRSARTAPIRLARRDDGALTFVDALSTVGTRLLLDTTVYIDALKGEIPPDLDRLVDGRTKVHSAVAIAELVVAFGRLDPADPRTERSLRAIEDLIGAIASERVLAPTPQDVAEGAI